MRELKNNQQGSIVAGILIATIFLTSLFLSMTVISNANLRRAKSRVYQLQAQYSAESGADAAIANLNSGNSSYTGSGAEVTVLQAEIFKSTFTTTVTAGSNAKEKIITSTGKVYSPITATEPSYYRTIEVVAQQSSTTFTSSMLSRNIIDIASGVKNIWGIDVFANGYINLNKNTTNLIAENISVAGKKTGATNCSIGGSGNLVIPTVFTHVGQTKTNINTAYNNCISPPGNTTNTNFNVIANTAINPVVSSYIPWSQYMDGTYTNAGSCNDWTSSGSTKDIPSGANLKVTHYPDSANLVANSCGTNGNIDLGTKRFNIKGNVHLRANLCAASACRPSFYNPDSTIKYVFIEGTINFTSLTSVANSGPIVLLTYGTDPNSHGNACPSTTGDSIFIGQHGSSETIAPDIYLLAKNGVCVSKTKFANANIPSLGGISGKNIYIDSSPGNPYDLKLDPDFPTNQIPIDLSWRATRYRRI